MADKVMTEEVKQKIKYWTEKKDSYDVIGTKVTRVDAKGKVTSRARYVDDILLPGMLRSESHSTLIFRSESYMSCCTLGQSAV